MGRVKAAITIGWRQCSFCNGVVATVAGRRENCESELNTWKSATILNRFSAWCSGKENPTTGANACIMGAEEGEKDGTAKRRE